MDKMNLVAPCLFGIEGLLSEELKRLGIEDVLAENGRVSFTGDASVLARANICSRFAERILIIVGQGITTTFTELFDLVRELPWENFIGKNDAFPVVKGWSLNSALFSISDCQKIIKKAIADRLLEKHHVSILPETGAVVNMRFSLHNDQATLMIDTSGDGLHKRGYRHTAGEAPIKETIAAAMCSLARMFPDTKLYDPLCGSGTILIEGMMEAANIAPGLRRSFAGENFIFSSPTVWRQERERAISQIKTGETCEAFGYDIDPAMVELTMANAKKAGVEKYVHAKVADVKDFKIPEGYATIITNPPYGERLADPMEAQRIYAEMGKIMQKEKGKKYYIITPDDDFEVIFGRPADKRRKLYNGMIKCQFYMFFR